MTLTPGPWKKVLNRTVFGPDEFVVALATREDDARLIAAAPALRDALKEMVESGISYDADSYLEIQIRKGLIEEAKAALAQCEEKGKAK